MATSAEQIRTYTGLAIFERAFRPFFLGAALFAGAALPLWLIQYIYDMDIPTYLTPRDYHIHEMIFGYLGAVITGFLLTAIPNWTGRLPVAGLKLMLLSGLWLAGRVAMFFSALMPLGAAIIDSLFLITISAIVLREVIAGNNIRNIPICILISLLGLANIAYHLLALTGEETGPAERAALALTVIFIGLIGGRVIPSFTRNWMAQRQLSPLPTPFSLYDKWTMALTVAGLVIWMVYPGAAITGWSFAVLAAGHLYRLTRWRGWTALREPMVLILHIGYLWLPIWFTAMTVAILAPDFMNIPDAMHALTAGAIGTMTLAIMTRATLGHSGRAIKADAGISAIYVLVSAGAFIRFAAPYLPIDHLASVAVSGTLWSLSFWLFVIVFGPLCWKPRKA